MDNIEEKLKEMMVERLFLDVEPEAIANDDLIMEKFELDSVRLFEMVIGIEDLFGIVIDEQEFDVSLFTSINAIADYIRQKGREEDK